MNLLDKLPLVMRKERKKAGLSQEKLGEIVGVTQPYINYIERGIKHPSLELAIRIADALNISLDKLCGRKVD